MMKYISVLMAGVVIGILVAPEKGTVLRRKLRNSVTDLQDRIDQLTGKATDKIEKMATDIDSKLESTLA